MCRASLVFPEQSILSIPKWSVDVTFLTVIQPSAVHARTHHDWSSTGVVFVMYYFAMYYYSIKSDCYVLDVNIMFTVITVTSVAIIASIDSVLVSSGLLHTCICTHKPVCLNKAPTPKAWL